MLLTFSRNASGPLSSASNVWFMYDGQICTYCPPCICFIMNVTGMCARHMHVPS